MNAQDIGGYRLRLANYEVPQALAKPATASYEEGKVILVMPDMTIKDRPYSVSAEMSLYSARQAVKSLNRAIKLLDPPKPRKRRG